MQPVSNLIWNNTELKVIFYFCWRFATNQLRADQLALFLIGLEIVYGELTYFIGVLK
jgi:hypothetical protein